MNNNTTKRNHLYLDTSKMNTKSLGEDRQQQASPVALSPMTKVIREAEKFVSRNGRNDAENNIATTNNSNNNNGKGKSNRNLDFDSRLIILRKRSGSSRRARERTTSRRHHRK